MNTSMPIATPRTYETAVKIESNNTSLEENDVQGIVNINVI